MEKWNPVFLKNIQTHKIHKMWNISIIIRHAPAFNTRALSSDLSETYPGKIQLKLGFLVRVFWLSAFFCVWMLDAAAVEIYWDEYESALRNKNCSPILSDLKPLVSSNPEQNSHSWAKARIVLGKCLLEKRNIREAQTVFGLPVVSAYADVVIYQRVLANLNAGDKLAALKVMRELLENPRHTYYLKRLRLLLKEHFIFLSDVRALFPFLHQYLDRPHLFLKDAKLHSLYMQGAEISRTPVSRKIRLLGWLYPQDKESARKSQQTLWPTDFESLNADEINMRVKTLQRLGLYGYLVEHLPVLARERPLSLRKKLGGVFMQAVFEEKQYSRILEYRKSGVQIAGWNVNRETQLFWSARANLKLRRIDETIKTIKVLQQIARKSSYLPSLYHLLAIHYEGKGRADFALPSWKRMTREFPGHYQSAEAFWRVAWQHYRNGRLENALSQIKAGLLHAKLNPNMRSRFLYWQGKLLASAGQVNQSRKVFQQLVANYPSTYYGLRRILDEKKSNVSFIRAHSTPGNVYSDLPPLSLKQKGLLARTEFLFSVLEDAQAVEEIMDSLKRMQSRRLNWEISRMLKRKKQYHALHRVIANYFLVELRKMDVGGHPLWELAFPRPYWQEIKNTASKVGIDPYFTLAVMREESRFNPRAVSKSDAMGLMQLMPATAREVARMEKIELGKMEDVMDPYINVQLGTHYLGWISSRFNDILIYTAGGYNAGPSNMLRWLQNWSEDSTEEFVEMIPFEETRNYVKRVYRSYIIYRQIYQS